ncbi:N-acetyltransferase [Xanthobacter sp. KR7-225]|uniref:GNAT family N-acetyltransferase n=1 Tax=Xanthobacter sp. KR7-225 TaxID=3156613 RepID=UPI0032B464D3
MIIRDEMPADAAPLRALVAIAFGGPAEADLVDRLRADGDAAVSLVAQDASGLLGHLLLSPMEAPFAALALAPLCVRPDRQRAGIGGALVQAGMTQAREAGARAVFVLGDPDYYRRFGFRADLAAGFETPYAGRHFMALALGGPLPEASGVLRHAPAFAALG